MRPPNNQYGVQTATQGLPLSDSATRLTEVIAAKIDLCSQEKAIATDREGEDEKDATTVVRLDALPPILTVKELADLLRLNHKTILAAIQRGEIPGVRRVGRHFRIARDSVLPWLLEGQGRASRSRKSR